MLNDKKRLEVLFAGQNLILDCSGALFWPQEKTLVIADLHLEKGSYLAKRGNPIPLYDTLDTLQRIQGLIDEYAPEQVITLGDNVHDKQAFERMNKDSQHQLNMLFIQAKRWIWIDGNHDQNSSPEGGEHLICTKDHTIDNISFTHDFGEYPVQVIGHFHPKTRVAGVRGKCFLMNETKMIMPSFGTFTGGFYEDSLAFKAATGNEVFQVFMIHRERIWQVK